MPHLKLATHFFGTDAQPGLTVAVTDVVVQPTAPSLVEAVERPLGERNVRVRVAGVSSGDLHRMQGTVWSYGAVTDAAGVTTAGRLSALELRPDDDSLEFILSTQL